MSERTKVIGVAVLAWSLGLGNANGAATAPAKGTFEVKLTPVAEDAKSTLASARLTIDKVYSGDLVGSAKGEMWATETSVKGSAGYVAIEKVSGTLRGRKGGFTLLHHGTMRQGADFKMTIVVVPDSGTGELAGLRGTMAIVITGGKHFYELDYILPDRP